MGSDVVLIANFLHNEEMITYTHKRIYEGRTTKWYRHPLTPRNLTKGKWHVSWAMENKRIDVWLGVFFFSYGD